MGRLACDRGGNLDFCLILRRTNALISRQMPEKHPQSCKICNIYVEENRHAGRFQACAAGGSSIILLQRGIADPSAKPPPFLGVSSLNLAASVIPGAAFFLHSGFTSRTRFIAPRPTLLSILPSPNRRRFASRLFRRQRKGGPPNSAGSIAVSRAKVSVSASLDRLENRLCAGCDLHRDKARD